MRLVVWMVAPFLVAGCSRTYHPEYHPVTSYTYAQSATYVQTAIYARGGGSVLPEHGRGERFEGTGEALDAASAAEVSSPGGVVIYGNFSGNIYLGR